MSAPTQSIVDTRRDQMCPVLEPSEIERVRRFGVVRSYGTGEALAKVGEVGAGLTIILAGKVDVTHRCGPIRPRRPPTCPARAARRAGTDT
jgi:thioredoxin reductase (NADPH)